MEKLFACIECKELQAAHSFGTFKVKGKEYRRGYCRMCASQKSAIRVKQWRAEESIKKSCQRLGLDYASVWTYYQAHKGLCEICGDKPTANRLVLDHCHESGAFRGLLCSSCNRGIGMLKDSPSNLDNAAKYLRSRH